MPQVENFINLNFEKIMDFETQFRKKSEIKFRGSDHTSCKTSYFSQFSKT